MRQKKYHETLPVLDRRFCVQTDNESDGGDGGNVRFAATRSLLPDCLCFRSSALHDWRLRAQLQLLVSVDAALTPEWEPFE